MNHWASCSAQFCESMAMLHIPGKAFGDEMSITGVSLFCPAGSLREKEHFVVLVGLELKLTTSSRF